MQTLSQTRDEALYLMKSSGYRITEPISVALDENLSFMGYTTERDGEPLIVVSGMALGSGLVTGLLVHELSHVYRTETRHPSHNFQLINNVITRALGDRIKLDYQEEIVHNIVNHLQDLYADDISFCVFSKYPSETFPQDELNGFFLSWVGNPLIIRQEVKNSWSNAASILSTAFAQANLKRHKIKDKDKKMEKAVDNFLSGQDKEIFKEYNYVKNFMIKLPEEVSEAGYEKILMNYIQKFLELAQEL